MFIRKIAIAILFASCFASLAQTNTNSAPIFISFTNSSGDFIANAEVTKAFPNKLIYKTDSGGGVVRLDALPEAERQKFSYNIKSAAKADLEDDIQKERQKEIARRQIENFNHQKFLDEVRHQVLLNDTMMGGKIIQKIDDGLLMQWGSGVALLQDHPDYEKLADDDAINWLYVYKIGEYSYVTANNSKKTIHKYTASYPRAFSMMLDSMSLTNNLLAPGA